MQTRGARRRYHARMQMQGDVGIRGSRAGLRGRLGALRRAGALSLLVLSAGVVIGACGGSSGKSSSSTSATSGRLLDMRTVVGSIEESFLDKRHIHATVTCPSRVEQRAGNNFTCEASGFLGSGRSRKPFRVHVAVTQVNNSGYVKYVSY